METEGSRALRYTVSLRPARATWDLVLLKKEDEEEEEGKTIFPDIGEGKSSPWEEEVTFLWPSLSGHRIQLFPGLSRMGSDTTESLRQPSCHSVEQMVAWATIHILGLSIYEETPLSRVLLPRVIWRADEGGCFLVVSSQADRCRGEATKKNMLSWGTLKERT